MGKITTLLTAIVMTMVTASAQTATGYEWWFDEDVSSAQTGNISDGKVTLTPALSDLPYGIHYFNIRLNNSDGEWGAPYRKMFMTVDNQTGAMAYEYWIDNDRDSKVEQGMISDSTSFGIDLTGQPHGLHYFNLRLRTSAYGWGSIYRQAFFTATTETGAEAYEYWFDGDYSSKKGGAIVDGDNTYTVSLEGLKKGLHRFNYRIRTSDNEWGAIYSQLFYYTSALAPFSSYEYWLDNDYANKVSGNATTNPVSFNVDVSNMDKSGAHFFNMRVRDDDGEWGSIYRKMIIFYNNDDRIPIIGYRHFLNGEDLGYQTIEDQADGNYTFMVDLPEGAGFKIGEAPIIFNGDVLSVSHSAPIEYTIQMESRIGSMAPVSYSFDAEVNFSSTAELMAVPSSLTFIRPGSAEFKAVKFESDGHPIYARANRSAAIDIYKDGEKVWAISPDFATSVTTLTLDAGTYYGVVHTVAYDEQLDNVVLTLDNSVLAEIEVQYDGRYATLSHPDEDVTIYYTLNGDAPYDGIVYGGKFDVGGVCTIKAMARAGDDNYSAVTEYAVNAYSDEEHAEVAVTGVLSTAFGWNESLAGEIETYRIVGPLDETDFSFVRGMGSLRYLDISSVECDTLPDGALAGTALNSVIMPSETKDYGTGIFSGCDNLSAVVFNGTAAIRENVFEGASNPNLLVYVMQPDRTEVGDLPTQNIVKGEYADRIYLTDSYPFYAPYDFTAFVATFTREFSKQTEIDGNVAGWETITVPFDVQTVSDAVGEVYPFASGKGGRQFWLYQPISTGWERTDAIEAYMPYLIAMPNHPWYDESKIISGSVVFSADNALIAATPELKGESYRNGFVMVPNYMPLSAADDIYVVNDESIGDYQPGSVFASGVRDVRPFESYLTGVSTARYMPVFDSSEVETLLGDTGLRIWSENNEICIYSGIDAKVRIHDLVGQLVWIADVKAGDTCRVSGLNKGIYLVGNRKLLVK